MMAGKFNDRAKSLTSAIPPLVPVTGWKTVPIQECGEPLVPMGLFSQYPQIFCDAIYYGEHDSSPYAHGELEGALITHFVRSDIAKKIAKASTFLPEGYALMIWDSYRPLSVQQSLYDDFHDQLVDKKGLSPEDATEQAQQFVSIPSTDPSKPSPHNTGASIDLTLIRFPEECWPELKQLDKDMRAGDAEKVYLAEIRRQQLLREKSELVPMGTHFDEVSPKTATRYYEDRLEQGEKLTQEETDILYNRRLLFNIMQRVGISNYPEEWWHFDDGNQFDARRTGKTARYGAAGLSQENKEWEDMRRWFATGAKKTLSPVAARIFKAAFDPVQNTGDMRKIGHAKARRLEITGSANQPGS